MYYSEHRNAPSPIMLYLGFFFLMMEKQSEMKGWGKKAAVGRDNARLSAKTKVPS